ncbi:MAG TPA: thioredoxin domain-containing protein [Lacunisphaera sp.]|nr:thioredoxin domain-containing protein [Lacunisphaera sp.]
MPNRLAAEKSPYLRQHADNPVDWFPWGEEAFARAHAGQKPIFLSIGYSTCHWCHVMAHESFENPDVAAVLNRDFVPVKLDREERPDLDRVYMTYVQHTTGHGGWPMSVWLTPGLKPFYGGTYFPLDDRHGRPGFVTLLNTITRHWREQREKIEAGADEVVEALRRYAAEGGLRAAPGESAPTLPEAASEALTKAVQYFHEAHDATWGGFGGAPKFPRPAVLNFLFRLAALQGLQSDLGGELVKMAAFTLRKMAEGGLHDHAGGGFHRYSVDAQWFVPHFEKMLYDQAQLAVSYLEARQATGQEVYAWIARGIFDYVQRDLTGPGGAFHSAEDADSLVAHGKPEHAEGAFYVWTREEIDTVLGADAAFFCAYYGVKAGGNVAHDPQGEFTGKNILMQRQSLVATAREFKIEPEQASDRLLGCLEKLRTARVQRPRPHLDDKVITAWNGLMISALAKGAQVLGEKSYLTAATRAAEFIERELYDAGNGVLYRSWREGRSSIAGFAEDYAFMIQGLLDLYETGFGIRWLQWAVKLQAKMDELFRDAERGGYFNSQADDPNVIVRMKEAHDGAEPSSNSIAALNLLRLDWMVGLPGAREQAVKILEALRPQWTNHPAGLPQLLCVIELVLDAPRTVVLAGDPAAEDFPALAAVLHGKLGPRRALLCADGAAGQVWLAAQRPYLAEMKPVDGRATAYVCENFACQAPVNSPAELQQVLG